MHYEDGLPTLKFLSIVKHEVTHPFSGKVSWYKHIKEYPIRFYSVDEAKVWAPYITEMQRVMDVLNRMESP